MPARSGHASPEMLLAAARHAARRAAPESLRDLRALIRIPSVSGSPTHRDDVDAAAAWLASWLRRRSALVRIVPGTAGPVVLGRVPGRTRSGVTTCLYGHLDVRPAGPGWTVPPFSASLCGRRLVARGASDDKGQLMAQLAALDAWVRVGGPPGDVAVVVETAEEIGSPGLGAVLRRWRRHPLLCGPWAAVVVADTRSSRPGVPSLTTSQRGSLVLQLAADVGGQPVHAGRFGGAVLDPTLVLADGLWRVRQEVRRWRARCTPPPCHRPDGAVARAAGSRATVRAGGLDHRSTRRGAVSVSRWLTAGPAGSIPTSAVARVDVRLPPGMPPQVALAQVRRAFAATADRRSLRLKVLAASAGDCLRLPSDVRAVVRSACLSGFDRAPELLPSGGSQPAVAMLGAVAAAPVLLLGLGPHDDGAHGPDEYLDLHDWARAIDTCVSLLWRLAELGASRSREASRRSGRTELRIRNIPISVNAARTPDRACPRVAPTGPPRLEGERDG